MSAPVPLNSGCCAPVCPSSPQTAVPGPAGENAFSLTTLQFTQPASGANVVITLNHDGWIVPGQTIFVQGGGYYLVVSVSGLSVTVTNTGNTGNAAPGTVIAAASEVSPGGIGGNIGNAYTTTTAAYVQPAVGANVNVAVLTSAWAAVGEPIFIAVGGSYTVAAIPDGLHITVTNLGYPGNAAPATNIVNPQQVTPSGVRGATGATGVSTLNGVSPTTTKGDIIVDNGANSPLASDVRLGVGSNGKALVADSTQATGLNYATITPNVAATSGDIAIFNGTAGTPVPLQDSKMLITASGALQSTPSGGNARGVSAVDLQVSRAANTQVASGNLAVISGGVNNTSSNTNSSVGGGLSNTASGQNATVAGGAVNTASGTSSEVSGGAANTASATNSSVNGGSTNAASAQGASVNGGENNTASGLDSTVAGGTQNTASETNSFAHGAYAKADKYNQWAFGSDAATTPGAFQTSMLMPVASTTNATPTAMLLNIAGVKRMTIPNNTVWGFHGMVVAKIIGTPAATSTWLIYGGIKNAGGVVTLVGAPTVTLMGQDAGFPAASAVAVVADAANVAMQITVTGFAATNIVWGAMVDLCELFNN